MGIGSVERLSDDPIRVFVHYALSTGYLTVVWDEAPSRADESTGRERITIMRATDDPKRITGAKIWRVHEVAPTETKPDYSKDEDPTKFERYVGYEDVAPRLDLLVVRWQAGKAIEETIDGPRPITLLRDFHNRELILGFLVPNITKIARLHPPR